MRHLVRVPATVRAEDTARGRAEADEEGDHSTEHEPEGVAVFGRETVLAVLVLGNAEEHHGEHPGDDGGQHGECGEERHEDGAYTVVSRAADTEEEREARETWRGTSDAKIAVHGDGVLTCCDGYEDKCVGQVVDNAFTQACRAV